MYKKYQMFKGVFVVLLALCLTMGPMTAAFGQAVIDPAPNYVKSIAVDGENSVREISENGGKLKMEATVFPDDADNKDVAWSVQNGTGSATISDDGTLTAVSNGTVTVLAKAKDGSGVSGSRDITIRGQVVPTQITIKDNDQPKSTTVTEGSITGTLSVTASVTPSTTLTYQWYSNTIEDNTSGSPIVTAKSKTFTIPTDLKAGKEYYYFCEVKATVGTVETKLRSSVAKVTVNAAPTAQEINISTQPKNTSVSYGSSDYLSVSATAPGSSLSYQWYSTTSSTSNTGGTAISNATGSSFTVAAGHTGLAVGKYYYFCEVRATSNGKTTTKRTDVAAVTVTTGSGSNINTLKSLTVSKGTLSFKSGTKTYTVSVPNGTTSITITAKATDSNAMVSGDTGTKSISTGSNTFYINVIAQNGLKTTYTVTVKRATSSSSSSSDATLKSLSVSTGTLSPAFSSSRTSYTVSVANSISSITISAKANQSDALVDGTGKESLSVGKNYFDIVVTADDGTEKTYTITVTRLEPGVSVAGSTTTTTTTTTTTSSTSTSGVTWISSPASGKPSRSTGKAGVRAADMAKLGNTTYSHDTVNGKTVQVRLYVSTPNKLKKDTMLSGWTSGESADKTKAFFEKWFKNKVRVIYFDQQSDWEQPVKVAAKVDFTGMSTKDLNFYAYDKKTNNYRRIETPAYSIDANGYLRFTTPYAGAIVASEGKLAKK